MSDLAEAIEWWQEFRGFVWVRMSDGDWAQIDRMADAARRVLEGEQWMVCEEHKSVAPIEGMPCERAVGTAMATKATADIDDCSIVPKLLVDTEDA